MTKRPLPPHHPHVNRDSLDRLVRRFEFSSMSDAKWVRLLNALTAPPSIVTECHAKLVWDDAVRDFGMNHAHFAFDFYERAVESLIHSPSGWVAYKEIEWIEFPLSVTVPIDENHRRAGTRRTEQDLGAIRQRIEQVGHFDLHEDEAALRLYAYRNASAR